MKTLYLLRHAKATQDMDVVTDFDRPLTERGYEDAHLVSRYLAEKNVRIDVLLSSPAIRAISTALIFATHLKFPVEQIRLRKNLYDSTFKHYLQCIAEVKDGASILLAAHNETITETAQKLSKKRLEEMKTSGVVALEFEMDSWSDILSEKGNLLFQLHPEMLKNR